MHRFRHDTATGQPVEMPVAPWLATTMAGHIPVAITVTPAELEQAMTVVDRYIEMGGTPENRATHLLDLLSIHSNSAPLDFARMAEANDFELAHDVEGIFWHIDRDTGKFREDFLFTPRCAADREAN